MASNQPTYTDLDLDMTTNTVTGDIDPITDDVAIKRSIKNIVTTNFLERAFNPYFGSQVSGLLFEPESLSLTESLQNEIQYAVENYEPRATLLNVNVTNDADTGNLQCDIIFQISGDNPDQQYALQVSISH